MGFGRPGSEGENESNYECLVSVVLAFLALIFRGPRGPQWQNLGHATGQHHSNMSNAEILDEMIAVRALKPLWRRQAPIPDLRSYINPKYVETDAFINSHLLTYELLA